MSIKQPSRSSRHVGGILLQQVEERTQLQAGDIWAAAAAVHRFELSEQLLAAFGKAFPKWHHPESLCGGLPDHPKETAETRDRLDAVL